MLAERRRGVARVLEAIAKVPALDIDGVAKLLGGDHRQAEAMERDFAAVAEMGIGVFEDTYTARRRLVRKVHAGTEEGKKIAFQLLAERESERKWTALLVHHFALHNFIGWKARELRYSPLLNGQRFSALGYSFVRPLVRFNEGNPQPIACPVVFDVLARPAETFDVQGLIERIHRAGANRQAKLRIMGVMGAPRFFPEAFDLARRNGLVVVNFREAFGELALEILAEAEQLFREMEPAMGEPSRDFSELAERFARSIEELKRHPLVTELSGLAFEALACAVLGAEGFQDVHTGETVPFEEAGEEVPREIDARGHRGNEWRIIECKAINERTELDPMQVKKFFTETVPAFIKAMGRTNHRLWRAELWTTGLVTEETRQALKRWTPRGVTVEIFTRDQIPIPHQLRAFRRLLDTLAAL